MRWGFLTEDVKIPPKMLLAIIILFSGTLVPIYLFHAVLFEYVFMSLSGVQLWVCVGEALFYVSATFSAVIGSLISERFERRKLLFSWIVFGVLATSLFTVIHGLMFTLFLSALLGASFGFGFPSSFAFLADYTSIEERARVSGIVIFVFSIIFLITTFTISFLNYFQCVFLCVILRSTSFFTLLLDPIERVVGVRKSWSSILTSKGFASYLFPWIMFNIADGALSFVELDLPQYETVAMLLKFIGFSAFAVISGLMADRYGRRQPLILGFIILGVSYVIVGLAASPLSWLIMILISSIAWSFITISFQYTVLGDLAPPGSKERFYALGWVVVFVVEMSFLLLSGIFNVSPPTSFVSSVLSIILFLSVLPLLFAPETLPEDKLRARRFKEYIRKVRRLIERENSD